MTKRRGTRREGGHCCFGVYFDIPFGTCVGLHVLSSFISVICSYSMLFHANVMKMLETAKQAFPANTGVFIPASVSMKPTVLRR